MLTNWLEFRESHGQRFRYVNIKDHVNANIFYECKFIRVSYLFKQLNTVDNANAGDRASCAL